MEHLALILCLLAATLCASAPLGSAQTAIVHFERPSRMLGAAVGWSLDCDGIILGSLKNGKVITTEMTVGKHSCQIRNRNLIAIDVEPVETTIRVSLSTKFSGFVFTFTPMPPSR